MRITNRPATSRARGGNPGPAFWIAGLTLLVLVTAAVASSLVPLVPSEHRDVGSLARVGERAPTGVTAAHATGGVAPGVPGRGHRPTGGPPRLRAEERLADTPSRSVIADTLAGVATSPAADALPLFVLGIVVGGWFALLHEFVSRASRTRGQPAAAH